MKRILIALSLLIISISSFAQNVGPWDLDRLFQVPDWELTDTAAMPGMTGILYSSIPFKGEPVQVFAYYSTPEGLAPEGGWPAVVCGQSLAGSAGVRGRGQSHHQRRGFGR